MDDSDDDAPRKRFRIERRRLGRIAFIHADNSYGFIQAEDFRDDVFFHLRDWQGADEAAAGGKEIAPEAEMWVEFQLDDEHFEQEQRLRAKIVRPTERPMGRKLSGRDATFRIVTHHPKARKKRPSWRKKDDESE